MAIYTAEDLALIQQRRHATSGADYIIDKGQGIGTLYRGQIDGTLKWVTDNFVIKTTAVVNQLIIPSPLTSTDDTNVTMTLSGTPSSALLKSVSMTLGWTGTLAFDRGGTGLSTLGTPYQVLSVNSGGTALEYTTLASGGTVTSVGTTGLISGGPITSSGTITTSMNTNKLVGRSTAGTGIMEEISIGTGLSLSAGTLNATAQSVGFEQNFLLMGA